MFEPNTKSYGGNIGVIKSWISIGIHNDRKNTDIFSVANSDSVFPKLINQNSRLSVLFERGNYMKQTKVGYAHGSGLNIYIAYKLGKRTLNSPNFTVQNTLFGAVKITKDVNILHYQHHGYGICFGSKDKFNIGNIRNEKNVITFYCDMSSSIHTSNQNNNIYVLGHQFIPGKNGTTIYAEKVYKTNFTEENKNFVLSLHYNGDHSFYLLMVFNN